MTVILPKRNVALALTLTTVLSTLSLALLPPFASANGCPVTRATRADAHNRGNDEDERTLFLHLVAHTHDDVGWLKTVEQCYYGFNNTITRAAVKYILDTVTMALQQNPSRKFTYVEMAFFSKWWSEQTDDNKAVVKGLVENGQLSFANGGWCMHDEAATHYMGMIDQTTIGHAFLKSEFDFVPTVGWQLDPFGHSATQASLLTSRMGLDALYFGRMDYQDLKKRINSQQIEGLWSASPNFGDDAKVFWGLTGALAGNYWGQFGFPSGFCFDALCDDDPLVGLDGAQLRERLNSFLSQVAVQANRTQGQHVMLLIGSDFLYSNAFYNFDNYDVLIDSLMKFQASGEIDVPALLGPRFDRIELFYSNPEIYTQCKHEDYRRMSTSRTAHSSSSLSSSSSSSEEGREGTGAMIPDGEGPWDTKTDDFFPYADCDNCYWTGYFTSRPSLKRLERVGSSFLHASRQIESYREGTVDLPPDHPSPLRRLEEAVGVAQHHDAVSGTSRQHVAYDYAKMIHGGIKDAEEYVTMTLREALLDDAIVDDALGDLMYCQLLNVTKCEVSQDATKAPGKDLYAFVYNALGKRDELVAVPVTAEADYTVEKLVGADGGALLATAAQKWDGVPSVLVPNPNYSGTDGAAPFALHFDAGILPAFGAAVFRIRSGADPSESADESATAAPRGEAPLLESETAGVALDGQVEVTSSVGRRALRADTGGAADAVDSALDQVISNGHVQVHFESGMMTKITNANEDKDSFDVDVMLEWGYYTSFDADGQKSGPYIFRPKTADQQPSILKPDPSKSHIFKSSLVTEVHVGFEEPWIKQITRIRKDEPFVEVEYTVGPIPIDDEVGKEVVARYSSSIESGGVFHTDSNGREFMKRKRGFRPTWDLEEHEPVAGNYYPINAATYIEDDDASLAVLVDRSQGGSSLSDGTMELMVHRRTIVHDYRGVREPLNETDAGITPYPPYGNAERLGKGLVVSGIHRIVLGRGGGGASLARSLMDETWSSPHVFVASARLSSAVKFKSPGFSGAGIDLPKNVMVITHSLVKSEEEGSTFLVRLGHQYAEGEDEELSKPVQVDMRKFYSGYVLLEAVETTLSGNQRLDAWQEKRLVWDKAGKEVDLARDRDDEWVWELKPMEIRTFLVRLTR